MATTIDEIDDLVSAQETATETSGKYFAINVPDYENAVQSVSSDKQSYLRLGAADPDWTGEPGADLIALAYLTGASGRESADSGGYAPLAEAPNVVSALSTAMPGLTPGDVGDMFIDDQRERGAGSDRAAGAPGHGLTREERRAASARLHTDVGWRDHTDGNRISTTRGDKVEVVYGNYKLVVLGRQPDPGSAQGWELGGDHIQDWAAGTLPGASVTVEWVPDTTYGTGNHGDDAKDVAKGAWLLENSVERVYQYTRHAGNFRQETWGDLLETYIGSENPEDIGTTDDAGLEGHPRYRDEALGKRSALAPRVSSKGRPRGNPKIVERTWAKEIDSQRGSKKEPVRNLSDVTHAHHIKERVFAKYIDHNTGTGKDPIGVLHHSIWADRMIQNYRVAPLVVDMSTSALTVDAYAGVRLVAESLASIQITIPLKVEAVVGWRFAISNCHNEATQQKNELDAIRTSITNVETRANANLLTQISNVRTDIGRTNTRVANLSTTVTQMDTQVTKNKTSIVNIATYLNKLTLIG